MCVQHWISCRCDCTEGSSENLLATPRGAGGCESNIWPMLSHNWHQFWKRIRPLRSYFRMFSTFMNQRLISPFLWIPFALYPALRCFHNPHPRVPTLIITQPIYNFIHRLHWWDISFPKKAYLNAIVLQLERAPESLLHLLSNSFIPQPSSSLSFTLPAHVSLETVVPLAAVLLDYAVAYVPSAGYENVLSGIPLDFYECILAYHKAGGQEATHTVMKFSCPAGLAQGGPTGSERIIQALQTMFAERLLSSGDETMAVTVVYTVQSLDHVAFWYIIQDFLPTKYTDTGIQPIYSTSTLMILISSYGLSTLLVFTFSMVCTTSRPDSTRPNIVCFLSSQGVAFVVMKNWDPFVPGPALAMLTV